MNDRNKMSYVKYKIYDHTGTIEKKTITIDTSAIPRCWMWSEVEKILREKFEDYDIKVSNDPNCGTIGIYNIGELRD